MISGDTHCHAHKNSTNDLKYNENLHCPKNSIVVVRSINVRSNFIQLPPVFVLTWDKIVWCEKLTLCSLVTPSDAVFESEVSHVISE